jgi:hypothetical protein
MVDPARIALSRALAVSGLTAYVRGCAADLP